MYGIADCKNIFIFYYHHFDSRKEKIALNFSTIWGKITKSKKTPLNKYLLLNLQYYCISVTKTKNIMEMKEFGSIPKCFKKQTFVLQKDSLSKIEIQCFRR